MFLSVLDWPWDFPHVFLSTLWSLGCGKRMTHSFCQGALSIKSAVLTCSRSLVRVTFCCKSTANSSQDVIYRSADIRSFHLPFPRSLPGSSHRHGLSWRRSLSLWSPGSTFGLMGHFSLLCELSPSFVELFCQSVCLRVGPGLFAFAKPRAPHAQGV